jgi:hypothetical protein
LPAINENAGQAARGLRHGLEFEQGQDFHDGAGIEGIPVRAELEVYEEHGLMKNVKCKIKKANRHGFRKTCDLGRSGFKLMRGGAAGGLFHF